ncbi:molybdopterin-dependent oxidoreductase [Aneurinibacillus sp. Ricciae_BoGa-3]|uniref:xanthine dehydrogenase family protein molybdopterin-binding subunit n=1 Tax=Aneurinibacillus sp. Ricciae_BoGa-3 TaxID=3022697 RepID=UPI0023411CEE|nr:molybdopterin cofactor-binding domain-containing protein [Aneurinibacillus sp. Ricciae_BoGa-3]WCK52342.1 molybdopterin-dependent oxidoreductase [Aneurinibacillus sp. Ricciae_BoGa-3]
MSVLGKSPKRVESKAKVTGRTEYVMNMEMPGMLHIKVLRSTIPHGLVKRIDVSAAEQIEGVVKVVTGEDLKSMNINPYFGPAFRDQPVLAIDKVRYVGDPVAAVIAQDPKIAADALNYIDVEYEELEPVFDVLEAAKEGAPIIHEVIRPAGSFADLKNLLPKENSNVSIHFKLRHGDTQKGFEEADHIFEDTFTTPPAVHLPMEQHVALAYVEPDGRMNLWTANQSPSFVRSEVAHVLNIPESRLRVRVPYLGGGFGTKLYVKIEALVAVCALIVRKPVKLALTMEEVFITLTKHGTVFKMKTGVTNDGRIVARHCAVYWDGGAYADIGPRVTQKSGFTAAGPYDIPNVDIDSYQVYTNKAPAGAFRGFGIPQLVWAYESQMDIIAEKMGWDPLDFRRKQVLVEGSTHATGQKMTSVGLDKIIEQLNTSIGWEEYFAKREQGLIKKNGSKIRAKGVAIGLKAVLTPSISGAIVNLFADGSASVYCSTVDMGQGSDTMMGQIAAEVLGLPREKVHVTHPDTDFTPYDTITAASRSTFYMGNAIYKAAEEVKKQILDFAANHFSVQPDQLILKDEKVIMADQPELNMTLKDAIKGIFHMPAGAVIGRYVFESHYKSPDPETGQSDDVAIFWFPGGTAVEIEVDTETGKIDVLQLISAGDVGKAINPFLVHQQLYGAAIMQLGQALFEECQFDYGQMINANMADYKVPTFKDLPQHNETIIVEVPHPEGPFGAKGVGETATFGVMPAIASALYHATGARVKDIPLTPERVLRAIKEAENSASSSEKQTIKG